MAEPRRFSALTTTPENENLADPQDRLVAPIFLIVGMGWVPDWAGV
jgi:hypothetical protein